ncbi:hypothetical protein [Rhodococcus sp. NPDC058514]|uniref:hypothetical protein n=1 Tax=unclassified Rhodococcus (in: high G+C Gram-positive bacteria) TaxID=192944 RepID=UPI0036586C0D
MKLHKGTTLSILVIATMGIGAGTSYAAPAPPDAAVTYQTSENPDPLSGVLAPHEVYSQSAYDNMITQLEIGWMSGGNVGAGVGAVVGCVLFIFVGCIPGAAIGATIGASNANPALAPAFWDFVRTLP